jgi:hypothetical protein
MAESDLELVAWRRRLADVERLLEADDEEVTDVRAFSAAMAKRTPDAYETQLDAQVGSLARELAETYLRGDAAARERMRALVEDYSAILQELVAEAEAIKNDLQTPRDADQLRVALAMLALNDQRSDWREFLLALSALSNAADNAGIATVPILDEFIRLSNATSMLDRPSTAQVFADARDARRRR